MNYIPYVIALYIRLSVEDCKVDSLSVENQKVALHQYVDTTEGLENAEVLEFADNGYSGTNFERPAVQRLLDLVQRGVVNCILVKDFSRFGRNSIEVEYYLCDRTGYLRKRDTAGQAGETMENQRRGAGNG